MRKAKDLGSGRQFDGAAGSVYAHGQRGGNGPQMGLSCLPLDEARHGAFYSRHDSYETSILRTDG